jgi:hypothetical protein
MLARLLFLLALLAPLPAAAQSLAGSWALEVGGTTMFRFDIAQADNGEWHATWSRPNRFGIEGKRFRKVAGPVQRVQEMTAIPLDTDNAIEVSFDDPRPKSIPDIFDVRLVDADTAQLTYVGTGLAPFTLHRVGPGAPLGPWDPELVYGAEVGPSDTDAAPPPAPDARPPADTAPVDPNTFQLPPGAPAGR